MTDKRNILQEVVWPMIRINRFYFIFYGAWKFEEHPTDTRLVKYLKRVYSLHSAMIIILWICLYILTQFIDFLNGLGDIVRMANSLFLLTTVSATLFKFLCLYQNNDTIRAVIKQTYIDPDFQPQTSLELLIIKKAVNFANLLRTFYGSICTSSLLFIILYPIVTRTRELPVAAYFPFDLTNQGELLIHFNLQNNENKNFLLPKMIGFFLLFLLCMLFLSIVMNIHILCECSDIRASIHLPESWSFDAVHILCCNRCIVLWFINCSRCSVESVANTIGCNQRN